jgi:hypothetical protein
VQNTDHTQFPVDVVPLLCEIIGSSPDARTLTRLVSILANVTKDSKIGEAVVSTNLDFGGLLFLIDVNEIKEKMIIVILNLLPTQKFQKKVFAHDSGCVLPSPVLQKFALSIHDLLIRCLIEHIGFEN